MGRIIIPYLNPLNLVEIDPVQVPQYISRFMDDYTWINRLTPQQQSIKPFYQSWQNNDSIPLQFQNNAGQITAYLVKCDGTKGGGYVATVKQSNTYEPGYFIYELNIALTDYAEGVYFPLIEVGVPAAKVLVGEPIYIKEKHEGTLLFEYKHKQYRGNVIFETGIELAIRVPGFIKKRDPVSKDTLYEDQVLDMTMIKSVPYRLFDLTLEQIPDWKAEILNWVMGCSSVKIDGRYYTKNGDDAKFESSVEAFYGALKNYTLEIRENVNRNSKIITVDENTNEELTIQLNVDSKGFADTSSEASSSVISFMDVE